MFSMKKWGDRMLDVTQLLDLEEQLLLELNNRLGEILSLLNRTERLEEFLELIGLKSLLFHDSTYKTFKNGKIVVLGDSKVKQAELLAIAKELGISRDRFEFHLGYANMQKFNISSYRYDFKYSLVMVGPMPHSGVGKQDASSIISAMESKEGYPPVVRLGTNGLKITKSDFRNKLQESIDTGKIVA